MENRMYKLKSYEFMDRYEPGRYGEKQAIKKNKREMRRFKRTLEKRDVAKELEKY